MEFRDEEWGGGMRIRDGGWGMREWDEGSDGG